MNGIQTDLLQLRDRMRASFNIEELKDLCLKLEIEFEDLAGATRREKCYEIIAYYDRRNRLTELITRLQQDRPSVQWPGTVDLSPDSASIELAIHKLREMSAILDQSWQAFLALNVQRNRLATMLIINHGDDVSSRLGYDEMFYQMYDQMDETEMDLFNMVRGVTERSTFRVNQRLQEWVNEADLSMIPFRSANVEYLEKQLGKLGLHLDFWFVRYETFFINDPKRSLVYLGDEKDRGEPFPSGLSAAVEAVVRELEEHD